MFVSRFAIVREIVLLYHSNIEFYRFYFKLKFFFVVFDIPTPAQSVSMCLNQPPAERQRNQI